MYGSFGGMTGSESGRSGDMGGYGGDTGDMRGKGDDGGDGREALMSARLIVSLSLSRMCGCNLPLSKPHLTHAACAACPEGLFPTWAS